MFGLLIVSVGLIALGLYFIFGKKGGPESSQAMVEATIVAHTTKRETTDGGHPGQAATTSVYPVYEYTVNGKTYRTEGSVGITVFTKEKYKVGARETVRINPANPNRIYTHGEKNATALMGTILAAFGLLALLMAFWM